MGVFENLPYSNFHEMNLAWVINEIKNLMNEWAGTLLQFNDLETAYTDFLNWFNTLNLQDEVDNKIDEMIADGTFKAVFSDLFFANRIDLPGRSFFYERLGENYSGQGFCYADKYLITTNYPGNNELPTTYNIYDDDMSFVRSYQFSTQHSNDMCYNPDNGKIIVIGSISNIFVFDFNDGALTLEEHIIAPYQLTAITYDPDNHVYYAVNGITMELYKSENLTNWTILTSLPNRGVSQTVTYHKGFLYFCTAGKFNFISKYTPDGTSGGMYYFDSADWAELEGVDFKNGNMIIFTTRMSDYNMLFSIPYEKDADLTNPDIIPALGIFHNAVPEVYVNGSLSVCGRGTADDPFNDVNIALRYCAASAASPVLHIVGTYPREINIRKYPYPINIQCENAVFSDRVRIRECEVLFTGTGSFSGTSYDVLLQCENCADISFNGDFTFDDTVNPNMRFTNCRVSGGTLNHVHVTGSFYEWCATCDAYNNRFTGTNITFLNYIGALTPTASPTAIVNRKTTLVSISNLSLTANTVANVNLADYMPAWFPASQVACVFAMPIYTPASNALIHVGYDRGNKVVKVLSTTTRAATIVLLAVSD